MKNESQYREYKKSFGKEVIISLQVPDKFVFLKYCRNPRSIKEMMTNFGFKHREPFMNNHLKPLIEKRLITMTIPEKPTSSKQKYLTTEQGITEINKDETDS